VARRAAARSEGRWLGIGLGNYVEGTGRGPFESAAVRIGPSGKIFVTTGAAAQGQGTRTMLAQLAAGVLGVAPQQIHVTDGDTAASPLGLGAYASRQAVTAGNAVHLAALMVADKARRAVSTMLEVAADDLELIDGEVRVVVQEPWDDPNAPVIPVLQRSKDSSLARVMPARADGGAFGLKEVVLSARPVRRWTHADVWPLTCRERHPGADICRL